MNLASMAQEVERLSTLLNEALDELREDAIDLANSEAAYRKDKALAWAEVKEVLPKGTVAEREAWVNAKTADLRLVRDMADLMRQAALEAVRSRRTQISSLQSLLSAHTEEAKFTRTAP